MAHFICYGENRLKKSLQIIEDIPVNCKYVMSSLRSTAKADAGWCPVLTRLKENRRKRRRELPEEGTQVGRVSVTPSRTASSLDQYFYLVVLVLNQGIEPLLDHFT